MTLRDGGLEGLLASIVSSIECPARERHSNWISSNVDIITRPVFYFALFFALFTFGLSFRGLRDVLCAPLCKIARNTDPLRGDIASNSDPS